MKDLGDEGEDRARSAYAGNYARLVTLKDKYDQTNVFRMNQKHQADRLSYASLPRTACGARELSPSEADLPLVEPQCGDVARVLF